MKDKNELLPRLLDYLQAEGNLDGKRYTCPTCGKTSPINARGASLYTGKDGRPRISCKKCSADYDVFGACAAIHGWNEKTDFPKIIGRVAQVLGYTLTESASAVQAQPPKPVPLMAQPFAPVLDLHKQNAAYMTQCQKDIGQTDYLTAKRALPLDILTRYGIGYDRAQNIVLWQYDNGAIEGRFVSAAKGEQRFKCYKNNPRALWNAQALKGDQPVWIVEGVLDALSILAKGGAAMAIGGKGGVRKFLDHLAHCGYKPSCPLLLALDSDAESEQKQLAADLEKMGVAFLDTHPRWKENEGDANNALTTSPESFAAEIERGKAEAMAHKPKQVQAQPQPPKSIGESKAEFFEALQIARNAPKWATPFKTLNKFLNGGLHEGLYVIGAVPTLGKTTFVIQMADFIAQCGNDVLYFSLEMSKWELVCKSISRHSFTKGQPMPDYETDYAAGVHCAVTETEVKLGKFNPAFASNVQRAMETYFDYARHIWISDAVGGIGIKEIETTARAHYARTGRAPVVVVDYMQIIPPDGEKELTDKQKIDEVVLAFKRISRDLHAPVIVISSINRASYGKRLTIDACKESGGIEYTCDFLAFLEFTNLETEKDEEKRTKAMRDSKRELSLFIKKNRGGKGGGEILFEYFPAYNVYNDLGEKRDNIDDEEYNENFPVVEINFNKGGEQ